MKGYRPVPTQYKGRRYEAKTYMWFSDASTLHLYINPVDVENLGMKPGEKWALLPWQAWEGVTEAERHAKEGTLAFLKADAVSMTRACVRFAGSGRGEWSKHLSDEWLERCMFRERMNEFIEAIRVHCPVRIETEVHVEREDQDAALILGPRFGIVRHEPVEFIEWSQWLRERGILRPQENRDRSQATAEEGTDLLGGISSIGLISHPNVVDGTRAESLPEEIEPQKFLFWFLFPGGEKTTSESTRQIKKSSKLPRVEEERR